MVPGEWVCSCTSQHVRHAHRLTALRFAEVMPEEVARPLRVGIPSIVAFKAGILVEVVALQTHHSGATF